MGTRNHAEVAGPIEKRDGFCFNLRKNCNAIGRSL
jgi:Na+/melibiose symporter-like transporter